MRPGENEPSAAFAGHYRKKFSKTAEKFFDSAVQFAGIDVRQNAEKSDILHKIIADHKSISNARKRWIWLLVVLLTAIIGWGVWIFFVKERAISIPHWVIFGSVTLLTVVFVFARIVPKICDLAEHLGALNMLIRSKKEELLGQLSVLYNGFSWHTFTDLVSQAMPELLFDQFLNNGRLADLRENFGVALPGSDDNDTSLVAAESGSYFKYPFVIARSKEFAWGEKEWQGSLEISWQEESKDSNGKSVTVTKRETLYASVTKPAPEYFISTELLTGHDIAPDLSFSRRPSPVSGKDGFFSGLNRKLIMGKLQRLEQNLTDDLPYTMMSNRDFEVQFHATDRDDEVQFRLLFTPLAQQQMVKLMNDKNIGYGDDFYFFKQKKGLCIIPEHLQSGDISEAPFASEHFDLRLVKEQFMERSKEFFRSIYFTFAPLMCIPLYSEDRVTEFTGSVSVLSGISAAELEAAVNSIGEDHFRHPESITQNILKVKSFAVADGIISAVVEAAGFRGEEHVEYVSRMGGDKKTYQVPVKWVEYIPVSRESDIWAQHEDNCPDIADGELCRRRSIVIGRR